MHAHTSFTRHSLICFLNALFTSLIFNLSDLDIQLLTIINTLFSAYLAHPSSPDLQDHDLLVLPVESDPLLHQRLPLGYVKRTKVNIERLDYLTGQLGHLSSLSLFQHCADETVEVETARMPAGVLNRSFLRYYYAAR